MQHSRDIVLGQQRPKPGQGVRGRVRGNLEELSDEVGQRTALWCGVRDDLAVRITFDRVADAVYIYLTAVDLTPGRHTVVCPAPPDREPLEVLLDWKDGKVVGLEILHAPELLHHDLLAEAELIG